MLFYSKRPVLFKRRLLSVFLICSGLSFFAVVSCASAPKEQTEVDVIETPAESEAPPESDTPPDLGAPPEVKTAPDLAEAPDLDMPPEIEEQPEKNLAPKPSHESVPLTLALFNDLEKRRFSFDKLDFYVSEDFTLLHEENKTEYVEDSDHPGRLVMRRVKVKDTIEIDPDTVGKFVSFSRTSKFFIIKISFGSDPNKILCFTQDLRKTDDYLYLQTINYDDLDRFNNDYISNYPTPVEGKNYFLANAQNIPYLTIKFKEKLIYKNNGVVHNNNTQKTEE